ncbi:MAG TPA: hypothetical protein VIM41_04185 [Gammaproteobacteria bacterium]
MKKCIAERKLLFSRKGSNNLKELIIRVGEPYWVDENIAACPIQYDGLFEEYSDAHGADLLQALHLAANVDPFLEILSKKYNFCFPNGEPYFDQDENT